MCIRDSGKAWQRIPLTEFPAELKTINVIISTGSEEEIKKLASKLGYVSAEDVREINRYHTSNGYYTNIRREPIPNFDRSCPEMIPDKEGGWIGVGWFRKQPSLEACLKYCEREKVAAQSCPCERLFPSK